MIRLFVAIAFIVSLNSIASGEEPGYAVAISDAPVLNSPDFSFVFGGSDGRRLLTDRCGQIRVLEYIAPKGTVFKITGEFKQAGSSIYRVTTREYPCPQTGCFVDGRFVRLSGTALPERVKRLPSRSEILAALESKEGVRYVWGGNIASGVREMSDRFPPKGDVDRGLWQLAGLDCSGLLYEATGGFTPRNTSQLVSYGKGVRIAGKSAAEIASLLEPLDLIVWPGHVVMVLDRERVIESRLVCGSPAEGVRIRPLHGALLEILKNRKPVDSPAKGGKEFSVRRWYGAAGGH